MTSALLAEDPRRAGDPLLPVGRHGRQVVQSARPALLWFYPAAAAAGSGLFRNVSRRRRTGPCRRTTVRSSRPGRVPRSLLAGFPHSQTPPSPTILLSLTPTLLRIHLLLHLLTLSTLFDVKRCTWLPARRGHRFVDHSVNIALASAPSILYNDGLKIPVWRIIAALGGLGVADGPIRRLIAARRLRESAYKLRSAQVAAARKAGATWNEIGACYGLTKQGAQQRFRAARDQAQAVSAAPGKKGARKEEGQPGGLPSERRPIRGAVPSCRGPGSAAQDARTFRMSGLGV